MKLIQVSARCFAAVNTRNLLCDANSGFINAGEGVVVDTQADLGHAKAMRRLFSAAAGMGLGAPADGPRVVEPGDRRADSGAWPPRIVVNTHEDIDHVAGNHLFVGAEIVAHASVKEHVADAADPKALVRLQRAAASPLLRIVLTPFLRGPLALGRQLAADYDFTGIEIREPTTVFDERLELDLDGLRVELIHVGPAHSHGDTIVHVAQERVVFAGDVMLFGVGPVGWFGTHERWMAALDLIESLRPEVIVPGHGPVCALEEVAAQRECLERIHAQARAWFDQGLPSEEAAKRIDLGPFADWNGADARIFMMVERLYREWRGRSDRAWRLTSALNAAWRVCQARGAEFIM